jgi:subtilisin family serine protease
MKTVFRRWFMAGLVLGILSLIAVVNSQGQTGKGQRLVWQPLESFTTLTAGVDYSATEVLAIYNIAGNTKNAKSLFNNKKLAQLAQKANVTLVNSIPIPARASDPNSTNSQVCGKILLRFKLNQAGSISDTIAVLDQAGISLVGGDALYGVAPHGLGLPSQTDSKDTENIWGLKAIQTPEKSNQGIGVRVAVLDTGVTRIRALNMIPGANFVYPESPTPSTNDDFALVPEGHGTGVAGIIGGSSANGLPVGVAPSSSISPVKVCRADGHCTDASVVMGVCFALSKPVQAKVLNVSLGSFINSPILEGAIRDANLEKALVVASAGNTREFEKLTDPRHNLPVFPAAFSNDTSVNLVNLMSIGAIDPKMNYAKFATGHKSVDMVAPGVEVRTYSRTESAYVNADGGTSYAAPYVSGTAALMFGKNSSLFPAQVKEILKKTADPSGCHQLDPVDSCGAGLLNVAAAVTATP